MQIDLGTTVYDNNSTVLSCCHCHPASVEKRKIEEKRVVNAGITQVVLL